MQQDGDVGPVLGCTVVIVDVLIQLCNGEEGVVKGKS